MLDRASVGRPLLQRTYIVGEISLHIAFLSFSENPLNTQYACVSARNAPHRRGAICMINAFPVRSGQAGAITAQNGGRSARWTLPPDMSFVSSNAGGQLVHPPSDQATAWRASSMASMAAMADSLPFSGVEASPSYPMVSPLLQRMSVACLTPSSRPLPRMIASARARRPGQLVSSGHRIVGFVGAKPMTFPRPSSSRHDAK